MPVVGLRIFIPSLSGLTWNRTADSFHQQARISYKESELSTAWLVGSVKLIFSLGAISNKALSDLGDLTVINFGIFNYKFQLFHQRAFLLVSVFLLVTSLDLVSYKNNPVYLCQYIPMLKNIFQRSPYNYTKSIITNELIEKQSYKFVHKIELERFQNKLSKHWNYVSKLKNIA